MTINHRDEALSLLAASREDKNTTHEGHNPEADRLIAEAQVHATLARDEEQTARHADMRDALRLLRGREYDVRKVISAHIAKALTSREPNRWKAGRALAKDLDVADLNVDDAINARLAEAGWEPRSAWTAVDSAAPSGDVWAPKPDITADVPERVRTVLAEHIAEALLDGRDNGAATWARGLTYELKREGADLTGDIEKRITQLTLGGDPEAAPF